MRRPIALPENGRPRTAPDAAALGSHVAALGAAVRRSRASVPKRRGWLVRRMLAVADATGLVTAFVLAQLLFAPPSSPAGGWSGPAELALFILLLPIWIGLARASGLYKHDEERTDHSTADDLVGILHLVTLGTWVFYAGVSLTRLATPTFPRLLAFWAFAIVIVTVARSAARAFCRSRATYLQNTVIVGAGSIGQLVARKFLQHGEYGINLIGFVDSVPRKRTLQIAGLPLLGPPARLPDIVRRYQVERVVIAFTHDSHDDLLDLIRQLKTFDLQVDIVPRLFELVGPAAELHTVEGVTLLGLPPLRLSRTARYTKRAMDVVLAALAAIVLAPVFFLVALAIKLDSAGPVFFRQPRVGTRGRVFHIYKLRTMTRDADRRKREYAHLNRHATDGGDPRMFKIENDPRVTRVGRVLRRLSLDELPQLLNVLKGEMSLVGPRPLIAEEANFVSDWATRRLELKPGITGLWQVLGRSAIPFEEMVRLDYLYVTTWSLWNDLRLMLRTLPVVVRGDHA
jgi:exopolysaccharide biosynthesis polyprenyl glycosylphosphotransferase